MTTSRRRRSPSRQRRDLRGKIAFAFGGSADVRQQQIENLSV